MGNNINGDLIHKVLIPNPKPQEVYKMPDKTIVCKDCNKEFVFTEGEQEFYKEKGFQNEPLRCPECRKARKQERRSNSRDFRH
ncbi:Probable zinc-ribbon domain-containing protein [Caloramator quimbayensis]|uniref:Probable zinc-ribbon domain-containing protein n=2 Tax=Caloramator quimbayensis TaxID=1147123 RepID=A0A1T4WVY5_9CLOT|nr:Probable zinc-ribbon domain-containing protein [Caloramator quimbayensis]